MAAAVAACSSSLQVTSQNGVCTGGWGMSMQQRASACGEANGLARAQTMPGGLSPFRDAWGEQQRLKAAQEEDRRRRAEQDADARGRAAQSNASPALLNHESQTEPIFRIYGLVLKAGICGVRSEFWSKRMDDALGVAITQARSASALTPDERTAASSFERLTFETVAKSTSCAQMADPLMLHHLDDLEYQLTGGYH